MHFVKYFDPKHLESFDKGCIHIGTLRGYRSIENTKNPSMRFQDATEGKISQHFNSGHELHASLKKQTDVTFVDPAGNSLPHQHLLHGDMDAPAKATLHLNEYVFCASIGPYDPYHHWTMVSGFEYTAGEKYEGSPELLGYAVFDKGKFASALIRALRKEFNTKADRNQLLYANSVVYRPRRIVAPLKLNSTGDSSEIDPEQAYEGVFVKPRIFRAEQELRFILRPRTPFGIENNTPGFNLQSRLIRKSMIDFGTFKHVKVS